MHGVRLLHVELHRADIHTRLPFKYGIATMTSVPHLFVRATCEIAGGQSLGIAADHLPPKWFTKDPAKDPSLEIDEMLRVIHWARSHALALPSAPTVFAFWRSLWEAQDSWARAERVPSLLAHFGTSLVERALIDAFCRASGVSFIDALQRNLFGIELGVIHSELQGSTPREWLPAQPAAKMIARHTVGLSDPLTTADIAAGEELDDGLPQTLEQCGARYGLKHFKVKFDRQHGLERLRAVAVLLERVAPPDYAISLDGNEGFSSVGEFRALWEELMRATELAALRRRLLFVEQPFHRDVALSDEIGRGLSDWRDAPALIIDESDGERGSVARALALGYAGASHKNCKGVFKGIANACLLARRSAFRRDGWLRLTGEDLTNIGPVALLQDLAVQAALGVTSVERNGHHYFRGLSMWSPTVQTDMLRAHPDLYVRTEQGWLTLRIENGLISTESVVNAPFGYGWNFDPSRDVTSK